MRSQTRVETESLTAARVGLDIGVEARMAPSRPKALPAAVAFSTIATILPAACRPAKRAADPTQSSRNRVKPGHGGHGSLHRREALSPKRRLKAAELDQRRLR